MKPVRLIAFTAAALVVGIAIINVPSFFEPTRASPPDARLLPPVVTAVEARPMTASERAFTGSISARVQGDIGFRVPGKIVERFVDIGDMVKTGQPLMRIDDRDLRLAMTAQTKAVDAARAVAIQARADESRYAALLAKGLVPPQRYEQAKATLDVAEGTLAAAQAEYDVAENELGYAVLTADADGVVVETPGESGQVVAAGQVVVKLAHSGQREATVALPETIQPAIGSRAEASVYGLGEQRWPASMRQLSNAADPQTRTYEARYVLEGEAAQAPIGATVTVWISDPSAAAAAEVPIGAILDQAGQPGVWVIDRETSKVHLKNVGILQLGEETAVISGVEPGTLVAALGAHLLHEGADIRVVALKDF